MPACRWRTAGRKAAWSLRHSPAVPELVEGRPANLRRLSRILRVFLDNPVKNRGVIPQKGVFSGQRSGLGLWPVSPLRLSPRSSAASLPVTGDG